VWAWNSAHGAAEFLHGVSWLFPTFSPDGRYLAYATLESNGLHDVYLLRMDGNSSAGAPKLIGRARNQPVFLNSSQLWYRSESQGICGPGGDRPLVYDVATGKESASIIKGVISVWPSTSSNW
jgi:Tol biopolymer transport system component